MGNLFTLKKTLATERDAALAKAEPLLKTAQAENRALSDDETAKVEAHLAEAREIKAKIDKLQGDDELRAQLEQFQGQQKAIEPQVISDGEDRGRRRILSFGQQFVQSQMYRDTIKGKSRPTGGWRSGTLELNGGIHAATLTSDGASGGDLIVTDYQAGIIPTLFERLTVSDLLAQGTTDSSSISYMKETTATNAAAAVAEGAAKPESTLAFDLVNDVVKKIATWLPVTDEMLDDVSQLRSYIDERLRLFIKIAEEAQLLNGSGVGANITGLRNRSGLATDVVRDVPDLTPNENNMDAIYRQIVAIMTTSFLMPDGIVMNPANWQTIALAKDANGQYLGAGPFNQTQQYRLWGLPVVATTAMTANTALVGAYKLGAQVFRKGSITVDTSNSHDDYFVKNLTAIRAEERLALAVYRPGAFGEVTGLN